MAMIARRPVLVSWQKATCSWSASPAEPLSLWGVANTLVTVVTLLVPSRSGMNQDRIQAYCLPGYGAGPPAHAAARPGGPLGKPYGQGLPAFRPPSIQRFSVIRTDR